MPTSQGLASQVNLSVNSAATGVAGFVCPKAGKIKKVTVAVNSIPTTATVAVAKNGTTVLSGATVDLAALTAANAGESQTLATAATTTKLAAGDVLSATTAVSSAASMTFCAVTVTIEWDTW